MECTSLESNAGGHHFGAVMFPGVSTRFRSLDEDSNLQIRPPHDTVLKAQASREFVIQHAPARDTRDDERLAVSRCTALD
ncbi:hypothetical protein ZHAS_00019912 [Anopheles sinensis]|uniref:Uncharacterized protein n=1 Tax=Anopheles sinensis TaxID=74873 RepID=A0A084WMI8_ANOSI|nr:hypothetical protein ZHAS_00019912 [Anopheles sinensis]